MMSYGYRNTPTTTHDHHTQFNNKSNMLEQSKNLKGHKVTNLPSHEDINGVLANPFGELGVEFTEMELRETAYEILVGACRSSGPGRPLTYVSSSERSATAGAGTGEKTLSPSPSLQRSLTSAAASKVKKALGLKSKKRDSGPSQTQNSVIENSSKKKAATVGELIRVQMRVSEQTDSRVRRALLRVAAGQLGRRIESMVLPLELLLQFKPSDFPNQRDYELWQKRNLKVLEAGLLLHPLLPLDRKDPASQQLRQIIRGAQEKPIETGKHSESAQLLRGLVTSLACRSFNGSVNETCHWADGIPLNLKLYQILLEACFDVSDETSVIEEVDELLELIKKTWVVLGLNQMLHNLCLLWVLFNQYVATGEVENDLLLAADNMLVEVEKDVKAARDTAYLKILSSTLSLILSWAEKKLVAYHNTFYRSNIDKLQSVLSLGVLAAKILVEDISYENHRKGKEVDVERDRVETYIRSSIRNAFSQEREKVISSRSLKNQHNALPALCILAQNVTDLVFNEKEIYSPVLKQWHPLAAGIAVATLHACYWKELKHYISGISELTPDAVQVLIASDKLEKDLVRIAVADSVDSEDGGKAIIQEMIPYEAEAVIANLVKSWINTRVERLEEWVERNLQQEVWDPQANRGRVSPSAVEILRIVDETLEAFFLLPIPMHQGLLPELLSGLDRRLQTYILKAKSGCGSRNTFLPAMPALTRCTKSSKFGVFKRKERSNMVQLRKSQIGMANEEGSFSVSKLCTRINTLYHIRKELEILVKRAISHLKNVGCVHDDDVANGLGKKFELSAAACLEGIQQLSEATAFKVVFHDLSHVLWDYLYVGDISSSRIEPFLEELEQNLEVISATVHDRVRTRVITDVMKASFEGFLFVLLAGGPSRAFTLQDASVIDEDLKFLTDLFWSNGDGLPADLIDKSSITVKDILTLFHTDTESLVEQFKQVIFNSYGGSAKSRLPLPQTPGQWNRTEPNTILRVLCHRNDEIATRFLKKAYNLPKRL